MEGKVKGKKRSKRRWIEVKRKNWDFISKAFKNLQRIEMNGKRQVTKSPAVDDDLPDGDEQNMEQQFEIT